MELWVLIVVVVFLPLYHVCFVLEPYRSQPLPRVQQHLVEHSIGARALIRRLDTQARTKGNKRKQTWEQWIKRLEGLQMDSGGGRVGGVVYMLLVVRAESSQVLFFLCVSWQQ